MSDVQGKSTGRRDQMKEQNANLQTQVKKLTEERDEARNKVTTLETDLTAANEATTQAQAAASEQKAVSDSTIAALTTELQQTKTQAAATQQKLDEATGKLSVAEERLKDPAFSAAGKTPAEAKDTVTTTGDAETDALESEARNRAKQSAEEKWQQDYEAASPSQRRKMWKARQKAQKAGE